jgi:hypothetical protein
MPIRTTTLTDVYAYNGSLLNLFGTLLVSNSSAELSGTLEFDDADNDQAFEGGETATFDTGGGPEAVTYFGGGTATAGVSILGLGTIPLGTTVPVEVFQSSTTTYMHYPEGDQAELLGGLVTNILSNPLFSTTLGLLGLNNVTALTAYVEANAILTFNLDANDPLAVCFCPGAMISTPMGERPVEELEAGDEVLDIHGQSHVIRWVGSSTRRLDVLPSHMRERLLPVVVPEGSFGPNMPERELRLSQQHRVMVEGAMVQMFFGLEEALVPAKALVGDVIRLDRDAVEVTYLHILCDSHVVVYANGLPAETLLPRDMAAEAIGIANWAEVVELFPELADRSADSDVTRPATPILKGYEGALLAQAGLFAAE